MMESLNQRIEDWLNARAESDKTKENYRYVWGNFAKFCISRGKEPGTIVEDFRTVRRKGQVESDIWLEEWQDVLRAFGSWLKLKTRFAPLTVKNHLAVVKSFLKFWKIPLDVDIPRHAAVIYHNRDLRREEVKQILTFATPRDRVIWLVMTESGMRESTAVNMKFWQIKEDFSAARIPMKILLPSSEIKDHVGDRWTFVGEDGFGELKAYLQGKTLQDDNYVFASERQGQCKREQFSAASLSVKFNRLVQKLGIDKSVTGKLKEGERPKPKKVRLHGLRKYFRNNMKADSAYVQFWMGHSLGVDAHYISRDPEQHREEYKKGYESLKVFEPSFVDLRDLTAQLHKKDQQINDLEKRLAQLEARQQEREAQLGIPSTWEELTPEQKKAALELLEIVKKEKASHQ